MQRKLFISFVSALVLAGCAAGVSLKPGAKKVVISDEKAPSKCTRIVELSAVQKGGVLGGKALQNNAINMIKNMAAEKHANYVYVTHNYSTTDTGNLESQFISSVTVKGVAYHCPDL